jgi:Ca2+-binding EF-hand superfamily protein
MVSKYGKDFTVPKDFPSVLKAFTREVLRSQPGNIYEFGAAYFSELMSQSQQEVEGGPMERLSPEQMEQVLVQLFREADVDGNNVLSLPEFKSVMEKANLGLDEKQMKLLMAEADSDCNGAIDYFEFVPLAVDLITSLQAKMEVKAEEEDNEDRARVAANEYMLHGMSKDALNAVILDVFKKADKDNSGELTIAEFQECIKDANLGLSRKEVNTLMHAVDVDLSGTISYAEFGPLCFDILVEILKDELLQAQRNPSELEDYILSQFSGADTEGVGKLKVAALRDALRIADMGLTRLQILTVVSEAAQDEEGNVDYQAFAPKAANLCGALLDWEVQRERQVAIQQLTEGDDVYLVHDRTEDEIFEVLAAACQAADPEGSGLLEASVLFEAIAGCELELSAKEVHMLMGDAFPEADGRIPYDNVVRAAFETLQFYAYDEAYVGGGP